MAIIISYPTRASGMIVLLGTPTKYMYWEFYPTLFEEMTNFQLAFNFEQMHTVTLYHIWRAWYNGSYTMMAKPISALELHYLMVQFLIIIIIWFRLQALPLSKKFMGGVGSLGGMLVIPWVQLHWAAWWKLLALLRFVARRSVFWHWLKQGKSTPVITFPRDKWVFSFMFLLLILSTANTTTCTVVYTVGCAHFYFLG